MALTFYYTATTNSETWTGADQKRNLSQTAPGSGSISDSIVGGAGTVVSVAGETSLTTDPGQTPWPDGTYTHSINVSSLTSTLNLSTASDLWEVVSESLAGIMATFSAWSSTTGTGVKTATIVMSGQTWANTPSSTARVGTRILVTQTSTMTTGTFTVTLGTSSYVTGPWSATSATFAPPFDMDRRVRRNSLLRR